MALTLTTRSGRVELRPPSEEYDEAVVAMRSQPFTLRYLPHSPQTNTIEEARALRLAHTSAKNRIPFQIITTDTKDLVGSAALHRIDRARRSCDVGIVLREEYARGGYATDALHAMMKHAFEEEKMHRVSFYTSDRNVPMRGWLEMAGVKLEGVLREALPVGDGEFMDSCIYGILESDWEQVVKPKLEERIDRLR
ncbi:N-acetyltransferase domain-containing protein [Mycena chlorophos]|uniref:N-acetyltransferase domain-containing protein n=1 Tax=Mycena chlorophos TaxID=658473 RepID=A0A8H6TL83_MYCCL|nr:N-acetyltransferase domain-containing protein [Mycena chlorophos]